MYRWFYYMVFHSALCMEINDNLEFGQMYLPLAVYLCVCVCVCVCVLGGNTSMTVRCSLSTRTWRARSERRGRNEKLRYSLNLDRVQMSSSASHRSEFRVQPHIGQSSVGSSFTQFGGGTLECVCVCVCVC